MKPKKLKYPFQRVEARAVAVDTRGINQVKDMAKTAHKVSIGTFTIFGAKPDTTLQTFTVAFTKEVNRFKFFSELHKRTNGTSPKTKSELIHLSKPVTLKELQKIIKVSYEKALEEN